MIRPSFVSARLVSKTSSLAKRPYGTKEPSPMCGARGFWYYQIEGVAHYLRSAVSEERLCRMVPQPDHPSPIRKYDGVRSVCNRIEVITPLPRWKTEPTFG